MSEVFLTSDSHFGHQRDFLYEPRGFSSIEEHDETIIRNWNSIVSPADTVYFLGDGILNDLRHGIECFSRLNGQIKYIIGNHDTDNKLTALSELPNIEIVGYATMIKCGKHSFYLSHYPTKVGGEYNMRDRLWNICGHSHTQDKWLDAALKAYHVELDAHNNYPVNILDIKEDIIQYRREFFNESH